MKVDRTTLTLPVTSVLKYNFRRVQSYEKAPENKKSLTHLTLKCSTLVCIMPRIVILL